MKKDRQPRLAARLPRGFSDFHAHELMAVEGMLARVARVYRAYGFEPIETPLVEYADVLGKFLPDDDRPNEGVFSFQDDDEQWLSLRYDLTAPLARFVAQHFDSLPKPFRSYRVGRVLRNEKPGPGRFREFMQFDADTVGSGSPAADAELCMMAADSLEALGIAHGDYVVRINSRRVLDALMIRLGLDGGAQQATRLAVLRSIDKLDRLGVDGVRDLLGKGRRDESGAFTTGAGLDDGRVKSILAFVEGSELGEGEGVEELRAIEALVRASGYDEKRIRIDSSVVRGLDYYTGAVFEAELLFEVANERGQPVVFGSVAGGGRYDGLIGRFRSEPVPATGFSIGVSRLSAALRTLGKLDADAERPPLIVVTVMDRDRIGDYQIIASDLRRRLATGPYDPAPAVETYLGSSGMKAQLKYADRRNAVAVIIQGSDERDRGVVQVKDLALGKKLSQSIDDNETWRSDRPAQFEVALSDLPGALLPLICREGDLG